MTSQQDDRAFRALTQKISRSRGVSCESYKDKCLKRRIAVRMRARGVHTYDEYSQLLDDDAHEYEQLLDTLTINVTKFYRNADTWAALADPHLAQRWRARDGHLRIWSAGCASGEEPYTIAVVVAEIARAAAQNAWLGRVQIDATDVDRASLERTKEARYPTEAFSEMPADLKRRYFTAAPPHTPVPAIQAQVRVFAHDLMRAPPPHQPYDLIICRNVVIYFERAAQERLFQSFADALGSGGLLLLGKVETLFGPARDRLTLLDPRERIYRKPA